MTGPLQGLTEAEAETRLRAHGPNALPATHGRSLPEILAETLREPMFLLLMGAAALYLTLGDLGEGLFLLAGAVASTLLVVFQAARSERALAALRDLAQPTARVIRDGTERRVPARDLVPGDLLLVGEGERLPADGTVIGGEVLSVDESALTGESAPVTKSPRSTETPEAADPEPGASVSCSVFSGTLVVRGQAVVDVTRTGPASALGRIGLSLAAINQEPTPLQKSAGRLATVLGVFALAFCAVVAVAYGVLRGQWVNGLLAGITVAVALIPEEFPMVLAVFLTLGAWRLAATQVLARRSAVIETLGAATVLCVDKTGTLTENRMKVARIWAGSRDLPVVDAPPPGAAGLLRLARQASATRPVDPMDRAIDALEEGTGEDPVRVWPLQPGRLAVIQRWPTPGGGARLAAKGAPEAIFDLCRLPAGETEQLRTVIEAYAADGLRVLGVAGAEDVAEDLDDPADAAFTFAGLVGFLDPLRADVPAALQEAREAGIKVIMITGDHPATAAAIARAAGIDTSAGVLTGAELAVMAEAELTRRLADVRVFARIAPDQKLALVNALRAADHVVAMTGDGVNDAPALEAAHIGVAMGRKGSDVAREAADLVLLDDSFVSIVGGVRLGRRIFANLRRAMTYVTAVHVPIAGVALAPIILGLPPILYPTHVMLLELIIDPTCALVFESEPEGAAAMRRPPRARDELLFGPRHIIGAVLQGMGVLGAVMGLYVWALGSGYGEAAARGGAFTALIVSNLALALIDSARSGALFARHRRIYWGITAGVALVTTAVLGVPLLSRIFAVSLPDPRLLFLALGAAAASAAWAALLGRVKRRRAA